MKSAQPWLLGGALAAGLVTTLAHPGAARACGGLFCSAAMPVNQAAERIIFSFDQANKKVTAVVEILYQGPSEKFAWVLPVPGIPKVGVSTSTLLDRLQSITNPTYNIQRTWSSMCGGTGGAGGSGGSSAGGVPGAADGGLSGPPGVSVLSAGSVGPYDYQLLKVDPALTDPAMVAIDWLKANGYDVGALGPDVLRPYLRDNLNLLAFKLTKKASTGSIRPIMISYDSEHPMIPIRPTAVAANDDMGILVWVLGSNRAVTTNYKTLELNEAMLDWFNPSTTYKDVVTAAADEAEGQGFVTEMAGPTATRNIAGSIYNEQFTVDEFRRTADRLDVPDLVVKAVDSFTVFSGGGGLPGLPGGPVGRVALDGVTDVLAKHLTLPTGVTVADVLASPRCYFAKYRMPGTFYCDGRPLPPQAIDITGFNRVAFLTDVEGLIIGPMENTVQLFRDQRYMTRLFTTMSAREMTLDPTFDLNTGLGDVSNAHTLRLKYTMACFGNPTGPWEATLESGQVVKGRDAVWPYKVKDRPMPVTMRIVQASTSGPGQVVKDNTAAINAAIAGVPSPPATGGSGGSQGGAGGGGAGGGGAGGSSGGRGGGADARGSELGGSSNPSSDGGCGCRLGPAAPGPVALSGLLLLGFALLVTRRRR